MQYGINTIDDLDLEGKTVIARFDLNSPFDRQNLRFRNIKRIKAAIPTVKELIEIGAKLVILTHQGGDLEYHNFVSCIYHKKVLEELLEMKVSFIDDVCGPAARDAIDELRPSEVLLLDNVRYMAEEMTLFETKLRLDAEQQAKTIVVSKLAPHGQVYLCDAFAAAHRDQPTLVGFEELLPSCMGRLFEKEYGVLSKIMSSPERPVVFLLGGSKIEDAFNMMPEVLSKDIADKILASGLLAQVFFMAKGIFMGSESEKVINDKKLDEYIPDAKKILSNFKDRIVLPIDYAFVDKKRIEVQVKDLPIDRPIEDIGTSTISKYKEMISDAKTVFVNGPAGVFENEQTEKGTRELLTHIASEDCFSVIGGGDSISAVSNYGLFESFSYMCTGGGSMVRFLSGEVLPVVAALKRSAKKFSGDAR